MQFISAWEGALTWRFHSVPSLCSVTNTDLLTLSSDIMFIYETLSGYLVMIS